MADGQRIVVIGASAGGVEATLKTVAAFPADLPAAVFVVVHFPPNAMSVLPSLLSRAGPMPAAHANDGESIRNGQIFVARPDQHLLVQRGIIRSTRGPRENGCRPAIDPLFRSAAIAYGSNVIGVVLSGTLDDGTAGLLAIKRCGGMTIAQDPRDATYPGMPTSAIEHVSIDEIVLAADMGETIDRLVRSLGAPKGPPALRDDSDLREDVRIAAFDLDSVERARAGQPSGFACPECGGTLWEVNEGGIARFRCRVGHAVSPTTLLAMQTDAFASALWTAFRALEENAELSQRLSERARSSGRPLAARRFEAQAESARSRTELVRSLLVSSEFSDHVRRIAADPEPDADASADRETE